MEKCFKDFWVDFKQDEHSATYKHKIIRIGIRQYTYKDSNN